MSDRFVRDERQSADRDADRELALRARQQMRAAVNTLRAGFDGNVLAVSDRPRDAGDARFRKARQSLESDPVARRLR